LAAKVAIIPILKSSERLGRFGKIGKATTSPTLKTLDQCA
jgi:hypothetical protein